MIYKWLKCENENKRKKARQSPACPRVRVEKPTKLKITKCPVCNGDRYLTKKHYIRLNLDGEIYDNVQKLYGSSKKEDAETEAEQLRQMRRDGTAKKNIAGSTTIQDAYNQVYEDHCIKMLAKKPLPMLSPGSVKRYKSAMKNHVLPFFGKKRIKDISHEVLEEFMEAKTSPVKGKPMAHKSFLLCLNAFNLLFHALKEKKLYNYVSPLTGFYPTDGSKKLKRDKVLTKDETERLLKECRAKSADLAMMVFVALNTGLRREGVIGLKWEHIDFNNNTITRTVKHIRKKGPTIVKFKMTAPLRNALLKWRSRSGAIVLNGYVFPSPRVPGAPWHLNSDMGWKDALARAGISEYVFHGNRHTFITRMVEKTKSLAVTGSLIGHKAAHMTENYYHLTDEAAEAAVDGFDITGDISLDDTENIKSMEE